MALHALSTPSSRRPRAPARLRAVQALPVRRLAAVRRGRHRAGAAAPPGGGRARAGELPRRAAAVPAGHPRRRRGVRRTDRRWRSGRSWVDSRRRADVAAPLLVARRRVPRPARRQLTGASRGWRGHGAATLRGDFSTGALKAAGTLGLALFFAQGLADGADVLLVGRSSSTLATNLFNLLDLRPGRSVKAFVLLGAALIARRVEPRPAGRAGPVGRRRSSSPAPTTCASGRCWATPAPTSSAAVAGALARPGARHHRAWRRARRAAARASPSTGSFARSTRSSSAPPASDT